MKEHVLFGISPFNTKFSELYINNMLDWGFENFRHVDVIHPHEEAKYLLMGCGNDEVKSKKKSRKEFSSINRIVEDYMKERSCGLCYGQIMKFSDFYDCPVYKDIYDRGVGEFKKYPDFKELCEQQTEKAILSRKAAVGDELRVKQQDMDIAVEYIMREIPFIVSPSELLGTDSTVHISYYAGWSVADYLYKMARDVKASSKSGLMLKDHSYSKVAA